jgi:hypothetical protein
MKAHEVEERVRQFLNTPVGEFKELDHGEIQKEFERLTGDRRDDD